MHNHVPDNCCLVQVQPRMETNSQCCSRMLPTLWVQCTGRVSRYKPFAIFTWTSWDNIAGGSKPRRYSRSLSVSVKARPLLYLGLRVKSAPEITLHPQRLNCSFALFSRRSRQTHGTEFEIHTIPSNPWRDRTIVFFASSLANAAEGSLTLCLRCAIQICAQD